MSCWIEFALYLVIVSNYIVANLKKKGGEVQKKWTFHFQYFPSHSRSLRSNVTALIFSRWIGDKPCNTSACLELGNTAEIEDWASFFAFLEAGLVDGPAA